MLPLFIILIEELHDGVGVGVGADVGVGVGVDVGVGVTVGVGVGLINVEAVEKVLLSAFA